MIVRNQRGRFANINDELRAALGYRTAQPPIPEPPPAAVEQHAPAGFDGGARVPVGASYRREPNMNDFVRNAWQAQFLGKGHGFYA